MKFKEMYVYTGKIENNTLDMVKVQIEKFGNLYQIKVGQFIRLVDASKPEKSKYWEA